MNVGAARAAAASEYHWAYRHRTLRIVAMLSNVYLKHWGRWCLRAAAPVGLGAAHRPIGEDDIRFIVRSCVAMTASMPCRARKPSIDCKAQTRPCYPQRPQHARPRIPSLLPFVMEAHHLSACSPSCGLKTPMIHWAAYGDCRLRHCGRAKRFRTRSAEPCERLGFRGKPMWLSSRPGHKTVKTTY